MLLGGCELSTDAWRGDRVYEWHLNDETKHAKIEEAQLGTLHWQRQTDRCLDSDANSTTHYTHVIRHIRLLAWASMTSPVSDAIAQMLFVAAAQHNRFKEISFHELRFCRRAIQ